jgi:acyl-CoA synthetase (AMP-forming)/AMP-acid ligase II
VDIRYFVQRAVRQWGSSAAVRSDDGSRSFAELDARASAFASGLARLVGLRPGDRVALLLENRLEYPEIDLALAYGGFVRVALNIRLSERDFAFALEDCGARAIVSEARFDEVVASLVDDHGVSWIRIGPEQPHAAAQPYETLHVSSGGTTSRVDPDAPAWISYTSGTTGPPKGVVLSQTALLQVAANLMLELPPAPGSGILLPQPLSHGAGYFVLPYLLSGASVRVMRRFDPEHALAIGRRENVTTIKLVPTMLSDLVLTEGPSPFQTIIYGAAPMSDAQRQAAMERFGPVLAQIYGQSEAPVTITFLSKSDHLAAPQRAATGRPWRLTEVEVVDGDGRAVGPDAVGEVIVRGRHLMAGYYQRPDATNEILRDGWVWTRDMARVDDRGYLYLLGRGDEMINSGGFNISPREVEQVIAQHPGVKDCVVVGVPDQRWGERVVAYVVITPGHSLDADQLDHHCRPALGFRRPRSVFFVDGLPRSAYGKLDRAKLAAMATTAAARSPRP